MKTAFRLLLCVSSFAPLFLTVSLSAKAQINLDVLKRPASEESALQLPQLPQTEFVNLTSLVDNFRRFTANQPAGAACGAVACPSTGRAPSNLSEAAFFSLPISRPGPSRPTSMSAGESRRARATRRATGPHRFHSRPTSEESHLVTQRRCPMASSAASARRAGLQSGITHRCKENSK